MKSPLFLLLISLSFWACTPDNSSETDTTTEPTWVNLMNGSDVTGWENPQNLQVMTVNGEFAMSDPGSDTPMWLWSEGSYTNFHLKGEFKTPPASQSAIGFRMNDGEGYSVNLDNNTDRQNPTGSITDIARGLWLDSLDVEGWNQLEVKAIGDHLQVWVNGTLVSQVHNQEFTSGKIGLQAPIGGKAVRFRGLQIMELPDTEITEPLLEEMMRSSDKAEMVSLFDGKTFTNWFEKGGEWEINDGVIHGYSGEKGGFLMTEKSYANFYMKYQFKIKFEDNSGVFIRHNPEDTTVSPRKAIECNIYDFDGLSHVYSTGSIVFGSRAFRDLIEYDEWNEMEIFAYDNHVVLAINGKKSSEAHLGDQFNKSGQIGLQAGIKVFAEDKGPSDIYFKDISIKDFGGVSLGN